MTDDGLLREALERQMNYSETDENQNQILFSHPHIPTYEEMVQSDNYIKREIRKLFAEYSITKVHRLFNEVIQEDFEALRKIIAAVPVVIKEEKKEKVKKVKEVVPEVIVIDEDKSKKQVKEEKVKKVKEKPVKEEKVKKVKEEKKEPVMEDDFIDSLVQPARITNNTQVFVTKLKEGEDVDTVPPHLTTKELREWQHAQETTKYDELLHKGIDPHTLLTVENLKKWVEEEKKSYSYIARRLVGLPEVQVAAEAKKHGIVSEVAKRRAAIVAARKK
jgi:hypothetical protein